LNTLIKYLFIACLLICLAFSGCRKEPDNSIPLQGTIYLQVTATHHSWAVAGIDIYIKKDVQDWPGHPDSTVYNAVSKTDKGGNVAFEQLFPGSYFIYAEGYDSLFRAQVYGKAPLTLDPAAISNNEVYFTLYVNE
jgi:hypothetical protein